MKYVVSVGIAVAITMLFDLDVPATIVVGLLVGGLVGVIWHLAGDRRG